MTDLAALKRLSRRLSYLLRHAAPELGLLVDAEGYVPVDDVLRVLARDEPGVERARIEAVIAQVEPEKQRFHLVGAWIRANYGHTLAQRIVHAATPPPDVLLHGTAESVVAAILRDGLRPMQRQYVHLTTDPELALRVGGRHGRAQCLTVDAKAAHAAGVVFHRANERFWLAAAVPARFVRLD